MPVIPLPALPSWRAIGGIALGAGIALLALLLVLAWADLRQCGKRLEAERVQNALNLAEWKRASAEAEALATKRARETEARHAAATRESEDEIESRLAAARAAARAHAARGVGGGVPGPAAGVDQGGGGGAGVPAPAGPAAGAAGAGQAAELADDAIACAEAVTKAEGWQGWWRRISTP